MNQRNRTEMISRRDALSFLGLGVALGVAAPATALLVTEADAQTTGTTGTTATPETHGTYGMQRRQGRRNTRHERRHTRRTGEPAPAATAPPQ
jgi:hypothetical protein